MDNSDRLEELLEVFPGTSRDEWLDLILKQSGVSDLREKWWSIKGLSVDPFVHSEDPESRPIALAYSNTWELAEDFHAGDDNDTNARMLEALRGGCERIILHLHEIPEWARLFKGVHLEMVSTEILAGDDIDQQQITRSLEQYLSDEYGTSIDDYSLRIYSSVSRQKRIHAAPGDEIEKNLAAAVLTALQHVENGTAPDDILFVIEIDTAFYIEIARLRALRIVWQNALQAISASNQSESPLILEVRFAEHAYTGDDHEDMIRATSLALSAVCGGADRLVIAPAGGSSATSLNRRIARNIHHLLRMEAKFGEVTDPVKGAFYFEKLTRQVVDKTWAELVRLAHLE